MTRRFLGAVLLLAPLALATAAGEPSGTAPDGRQAPWQWQLPLGFPVPRVPATNAMSAAKVELGRRLFYDRRLSAEGTVACATCHRQALAFTDGRPRAVGETGEVHPRGAMSLANAAYSATLTWADPSMVSLEDQALVPLFGEKPIEMGARGHEQEILARLGSDQHYRRLFPAAFPDQESPIAWPAITLALAAFQRTLISGGSPYDRFVYRDEPLPAAALRGKDLFFDRFRCVRCHSGFSFSGPVIWRGSEDVEPSFVNTGLYDLIDRDGQRGAYPDDNQGLFAHTGRRVDMGAFRAPTLRNVAVTAPYMHDGSIATLEGVIDHYAAGGRTDNRHKSPLLEPFSITDGERRDLIAFLGSLTDRDFLRDPRFGDPWPRVDR